VSSGQPHTFTLGGFLLTGTDGDGCFWTVSDIQGWFTGSDIRTATQSKAQQSGSWRGKTFPDGRIIVARGQVTAPSTAVLELAGRRLSALLRDGSFDEFMGESEAGSFTSLVQMDSTPQFTPLSDVKATWQVAVGSEDPLLYGPVWYSSATLAGSIAGAGRAWPRAWTRDWGVPAGTIEGAVSVPNAGLATYWPRFRIYGPVTNPTVGVAETGALLTFHGTIPAGQFIDIDAGARTVTYGPNADDVRYLTDVAGNWPAVIPGGVSVTYDADTADPAAVLHVYGYEGAWH